MPSWVSASLGLSPSLPWGELPRPFPFELGRLPKRTPARRLPFRALLNREIGLPHEGVLLLRTVPKDNPDRERPGKILPKEKSSPENPSETAGPFEVCHLVVSFTSLKPPLPASEISET